MPVARLRSDTYQFGFTRPGFELPSFRKGSLCSTDSADVSGVHLHEYMHECVPVCVCLHLTVIVIMNVRACVLWVCTNACVDMCECVYVWICVCARTCLHVNIHVSVYRCMRVYVCMHSFCMCKCAFLSVWGMMGRSSSSEHSTVKVWILLHGCWILLRRCICNLGYFPFQPVAYNWSIKGCGMCYPVYGKVHIKDLLLLNGKSSLYGGSGFPLMKYVAMTICLMSIQ